MPVFKKYVTLEQVKTAFNALSESNNTDLAKFVFNGVTAIKQKKENAESLRQTHARLVDEAQTARIGATDAAADGLNKANDVYDHKSRECLSLREEFLRLLSAAKELDKNPNVGVLLKYAYITPNVFARMVEDGKIGIGEANQNEADAKEKLEAANTAYTEAITVAGATFAQAVKNAAVNLEKAAQLEAEAITIAKGVKFFS